MYMCRKIYVDLHVDLARSSYMYGRWNSSLEEDKG